MPKPRKSQPVKRKFKATRAGALLQKQIRGVAETRGFVHARLLTEWDDIVGPDIARLATPLKVGFGRRDLGATLHVTVRPGAAPEVQMQERVICERVNTCYGYNAISRVRIVSAGAVRQPKPVPRARRRTQSASDQVREEIRDALADVKDPALRAALEGLASSIRRSTTLPEDRT
jgi:hypothetical protein